MNNAKERKKAGQVVWITGLSGAGKSTLASALVKRLRAHDDTILLLDGDEIREFLSVNEIGGPDYSREKRIELGLRYARLCNILATQGFTVVIGTISLFGEVHRWNRAHLPRYFEVYLKVPLEELRRRDPKGIYRRFEAGQLKGVAGLDIPIDEPKSAEWVMEYVATRSVEEAGDELFSRLMERNKFEN